MSSTQAHPLEHSWALWEIKPFSTNKYCRAVCEFNTVEKFWESWYNMPKPSEVFGDGTKKVTVGGVEIKTLGIFKKNISPIWEDKANADGFQLEATRTYNTECMDVQWENLVLGLIGETIDDDDQICGARLVNQVKKGAKAHCYKIEVWLKKKDEEVANKIKARLGEVLCDVDKSRPHLRMPAEEFVLERRAGRH